MAAKAFESGLVPLSPYLSSRSLPLALHDHPRYSFCSAFAHSFHIRRAMKRGLLDVAEKGLVLKDANGTVVSPRRATGAL